MELGRLSEPWKSRETRELKEKIKDNNYVPLPEDDLLYGKILKDYIQEIGDIPSSNGGKEALIKYWSQNRSKCPPPLTEVERKGKRRKEEEWEMRKKKEREERLSYNWVRDLHAKYPYGSYEHYYQQEALRKRRIEMEEPQQRAEEEQLEVMRSLVGDLPGGVDFGKGNGGREMAEEAHKEGKEIDKGKIVEKGKGVDDGGSVDDGGRVDKGKGVVVIISDDDRDDDWEDDEVISGYEGDQHGGPVVIS